MIVVIAFLGIGIGVMIARASDYFPRYAVTRPKPRSRTSATGLAPALWGLLRGQREDDHVRLHAAVEVVSALFLAFLWAQFGATAHFAVYAVGYVFLMLIALIDIKYRLVLNIFVYPAIVSVLVIRLVAMHDAPLNVLLGGAFAFFIFYGTARIKPDGLGGGDIKLAALLGLAFGFPQILWPLLVGALTAGVLIAYLLLTRRGGLQSTLPYAPFLCFGAMAALLYNPLLTQGGLLL